MPRLPRFELHEPETVDAATALLSEHGPEAMIVAGGTDLYPKMKRRQMTPEVLISLGEIDDMRGIENGDGVRIGAKEPVNAIASHSAIQSAYPGVAEAAQAAASPTIRTTGTIGGNLCQDTRCRWYDRNKDWRESLGWCKKAPGPDGVLLDGAGSEDVPCRVAPGSPRCWAVFCSDNAPALIAHDASVRLVGTDGERTVPLSEFYRDEGADHLEKAHDEVLVDVHLPPAEGVRSTYRKLSARDSVDFPSVGIAVAVRQAEDGTVERARIVLTGVGSAPVDAEEAADILEGARPDDELLEEVGQAVGRAIRPMDTDAFYHPATRKQLAVVHTGRAIGDVTTA